MSANPPNEERSERRSQQSLALGGRSLDELKASLLDIVESVMESLTQIPPDAAPGRPLVPQGQARAELTEQYERLTEALSHLPPEQAPGVADQLLHALSQHPTPGLEFLQVAPEELSQLPAETALDLVSQVLEALAQLPTDHVADIAGEVIGEALNAAISGISY